LEEGIAILKKIDNKCGIELGLYWLGMAAQEQGHHQRAEALLEESLAMSCERESQWGIASALCHLGHVALEKNAQPRPRRSSRSRIAGQWPRNKCDETQDDDWPKF
jgi:hypothetical protein